MKKFVLGLLCLLLMGCSSTNQDYDTLLKEYDVLVEEYKQLKVNYKELQKSNDSLNEGEGVEISGGFVATVRDVMPDNCVDDFTSRLVLLQWFQGDTFVLRIDEKAVEKDLGKRLENKTYYFEIEPVVVEKEFYNMSVEDVNDMLSASLTVHNWIKIKDFREVKDDEGGLNSWFINVEPVK